MLPPRLHSSGLSDIEEKLTAGVRLDLRDEATRATKSGRTPIMPGKPEASELVRRIFAEDDDVTRRAVPASCRGKKVAAKEQDPLEILTAFERQRVSPH